MPRMEVVRDIAGTRVAVAAARRHGRRIGLVPTMGALHRGHTSLIDAARRDGCFVVVSIFVNPTQFAPGEDFSRYPRNETGDLETCAAHGVELAFVPPVEVMYGPDAVTTIHVARLTDTLCGPHRPGHFDGVATIVAKLFQVVQPDAAWFGKKDAQQLAVIRRIVRDLDMPIEIVGCPTVREDDGLALSSRNAYLSPAERRQAASLYRALGEAQQRIQAGQRNPQVITEAMRRILDEAGPNRADYISIVDPESMQPLDAIAGPALVALAVRIGHTRLIDNLLVDPHSAAS